MGDGGGGGVAAATSNSYSQANAVSLSEGWRYGGKEPGERCTDLWPFSNNSLVEAAAPFI